MANPATTHVIEIEAGIGEPAFIPLSMGSELQPISVGKKGMWRIESPRVLDVHAFVYFDGSSLFLQSADDANAASVDGYRVGKAWTELSAPCHIEIGQARLKFRSLSNDEDSATQIAPNAPVAAPPGGPGGFKSGSQPGASMPVAVAAAPPVRISNATGSRPNESSNAPPVMSFPKADRPFKPGEFSQPPDDESTRIAPLESTGAGRIVSGAHPVPRAPTGAMPVQPLQFPGAMMGVPPPPGSDAQQMGMMNAQQGFDAQMQMMPGPPGFDQASMPFSNANGPQSPMMGAPMMGQLPPMGQPVPGAPGSYPGQQPMYGNGMPPNGMYPGAMGPGPLDVPQPGMPPPAPPPKTYDKLKVALGGTSPITAFAGLVIILGGVLFLYADDEPPPPPRRTTPSASASASGGGAASVSTTPPVATLLAPPSADAGTPMAGGSAAWPPGVPCPPPGWPAGTPLPCSPANNAADAGTTSSKPEKPDNTKPDKPDNSRGGSKSPSTPTLERQAVDHVAAGETAKAAADYDELVRREPNNRVYAEAARILRAKLDAGAP